jgi:hypothetical protein
MSASKKFIDAALDLADRQPVKELIESVARVVENLLVKRLGQGQHLLFDRTTL